MLTLPVTGFRLCQQPSAAHSGGGVPRARKGRLLPYTVLFSGKPSVADQTCRHQNKSSPHNKPNSYCYNDWGEYQYIGIRR